MENTELERFRFAQFKFHLEPIEPLHLPIYKGSALRGGFGNVFKKTVCLNPEHRCSECILQQSCVYCYVFETPGSETLRTSYSLSEYPHPFIIEPPIEERLEYAPGQELTFHLTLIGRAIDYLPYFVFAYQQLGRKGLGKGRGRYLLVKVESDLDGLKPVFDAQSQTLLGDFTTKSLAQLKAEQGSPNLMRLEFLTPTRIKYRGRLTARLDFKLLMKSLLRRILLLSELHCNQKLQIDCERLLREAEAVKTLHSGLHWHDWQRYSSRQQTRMRLGGFLGQIVFQGDLTEFMPFVKLGEYIHVGKGTSFGLGKYRITDTETVS